MLDRERILAKLDELDGYVRDLQTIAPQSFTEYQQIEKKRTCERLLQIAVECVIDVCKLLVSGLRLGLPAEEDDLFEKLEQKGILSSDPNLSTADIAIRALFSEAPSRPATPRG